MVKMHKHSGVARSDTGALRSHPVTQKHKDIRVQSAHKTSLNSNFGQSPISKKKSETFNKVSFKKDVLCPVDSDGYINIDLSELKQQGVRLKFTRTQGRTKKTVGLQIER